jgi:tetratricopeptide (TPR) repeat protein
MFIGISGKDKIMVGTKNISSVSPARGQLITLLDHYNSGRDDEAETLALSLSQQFPEHQFSYRVLGAILGKKGLYAEAKVALNRALAIGPREASIYNDLAVMFNKLGRFQEAELNFKKALDLEPDLVDAHLNLGNLFREVGRNEEALEYYLETILLSPDLAAAHNNMGVALEDLDKLEEAEKKFKQAITLKADYFEAHSNLGRTLKKLKKYEEAIYHYDFVRDPNSVSQSLECLYFAGNHYEFDRRLGLISEEDDMNIRIAAVSAFVSHQMKKIDPYPFCRNPLDFIIRKNLLDFDPNAHTLIDEIVHESNKLQLVWESRTTKFGFQGANDFFDNSTKNIEYLERVALKAVEEYYNKFRFEKNLFIQLWPKKHKLKGWYNRLLKNGYQNSHIHAGGWLSGVIYLKTIDTSHNDEGAIEFGLHGYDLPIRDKNYPRKLFKPRIGDIILFPSSLFHRTLPFTQNTERCVVAFDLMPT